MSADRPLVLVADDDPDILELVGLRLRRAGYDVVSAPDGFAALDLVRDRTPDLAIVDVTMPRMNGHQLMRELRSRPATASLPILVLTAAVDDRVAIESLEAGADAQMSKPFSARELMSLVAEMLDRAGGATEHPDGPTSAGG